MVRTTYTSVWAELHHEPEFADYDRHAIRARIRRLNDLGFAVDEIRLEPSRGIGQGAGGVRLDVAVANRRFHGRRLERLTGLVALEGQARLLLNDIREYRAWLEFYDKRPVEEGEAAERWLREVFEPTLAVLAPAVGEGRDLVQAYCDVLEEKWILSEMVGKDVGLEAALDAYLGLGAPAPEDDRTAAESGTILDIDWSGGLDVPDADAEAEADAADGVDDDEDDRAGLKATKPADMERARPMGSAGPG